MRRRPALIACSHGTRSPRGTAAVAALVTAVRESLPRTEVVDAFVDVQEPALPDVLATLAGRSAVVVPLLLSAGHHVHHDVARAVGRREEHRAVDPLGPSATLTDVLMDRLAEVGLRPEDGVVLGASSSSDPAAVADQHAAAAALSERLGRPVPLGHVGHCGTALSDVVEAARRPGRRMVVASYLLAPGHFHDALGHAGADLVTTPLLDERRPDPRLVSLVLERYAAAFDGRLAAAS